MSRKKIFSVFDSKAGAYAPPFCCRTSGEAIRGFEAEVNSSSRDSIMSAHPADFTLFELGEFDELTGALVPAPSPHSHGLAVQYKKQPVGEPTLFDSVKKVGT